MAGLGPPAAGDPARIGPYRLVGRLGQGGWGTVHGALDDAGRRVAVEVLDPRAAADPAVREAFAHRAEALRGADTVCAPHVLDADAAAEAPWIATAHAPGPDLGAYLRAHGPLDEDALLAFAAGTAEALARMHAAGAVHGDLRPSRVVLTPSGPRLSGTGAPRPGADAAADVAAWGALVAAAGTGRAPYGPDGAPDLAGVPGSLEPMLQAAMDPRPPARPDAESIYRGLVDYAVDQDIRAVPTAELSGTLREVLSVLWAGPGRAVSAQPKEDWGAEGAEEAAATEPTTAPAEPAAMGRVPGTRLAAVVAAAVIGTTGAGVGGLYAARTVTGGSPAPVPSPSPSPTPELGGAEEVVDGIVALFEETDSYRVVEEVDEGGAEPLRQERVFRADPDVFLSISGGGPTERVETVWLPDLQAADRRRFSPGAPPGSAARYTRLPAQSVGSREFTREAGAAPFDDLAESMEVVERTQERVDGRDTTRFSGTFTFTPSPPGTEAEHGFTLWVDAEGRPVRLEHGEDVREPDHTLEYSGFDGELDTWLCGAVSGVPQVDEAALVGTSEEVSCASARAAAEAYLAMPDAEKSGTGSVAEDVEGWYCTMAPTAAEAGSCSLDHPQQSQRVDFIRLD
ncbi:serine/threonine-protein kinase [Nocardiopsis baichengensis]|uniref:serine/threonine-protein kinase n=1 Tax=Nocardiopsis baichengensis TaxID=280240 RepID=UPI00034D11EE|nr:protein kinase [Nocardiopsis baichengensis]